MIFLFAVNIYLLHLSILLYLHVCRCRVSISLRLSEEAEDELTAGLTARQEKASLPSRVIVEGPQVAGTNVFTVSVTRDFPASAGTD